MSYSNVITKQACKMLSARSAEHLLEALAATDISVPARTKGRTTEHTERYSISRLLSTLAESDYLSYPLSLIKRERPDFLLDCNGQRIGIEVTEATSTDYSSYQAYVQNEKPGHFIEPSHFRHGKELSKRTKQELLEAKKITGTGWYGDEAENEWSHYINDAIKNKTKKLIEPSFAKFNQNWLLIYDNCPAHFLNKKDLIPYIEKLILKNSSTPFDMIFIESHWFERNSSASEAIIFAISRNDWAYFSVKDIWKK